ncbi:MAG: hypothetical protein HYV28_17390 [Ignavibacteriales bacterium]|nr:hypothetical protein [Ignavibacteriales bacterium]
MAKEFDILLKSVRVMENGTFDEKGVNTIKFTLHYPESGTKQVSTIVNMELEDNKETIYEKEWQDKMLFRQKIDSDCVLFIEISSAIKKSAVEKILLKILKGLVGAGIDLIPSVGKIISSSLNDEISNYFDELAKDKIYKIAEGSFPISTNMDDCTIPINLICPKEVKLESKKYDAKGNCVITTKIIPKDYGNAMVIIIIDSI